MPTLAIALAFGIASCTSPPIRVLSSAPTTTGLPLEVTETTVLPERPSVEQPAAALVTSAATGSGTTELDAQASRATTSTAPERFGAAAIPNPEGVVLASDGLGIATFGMNVPTAMRRLEDALGRPVTDSGWIDAYSIYGACDGNRLRGVEWPGLLVLFGNADDGYLHRDADDEHFMTWRLGWQGPDPYLLGTSEEIGIGSTRAEVAEAYPSATFEPASAGAPPSVAIPVDGGELRATFNDTGALASIEAGAVCAQR